MKATHFELVPLDQTDGLMEGYYLIVKEYPLKDKTTMPIYHTVRFHNGAWYTAKRYFENRDKYTHYLRPVENMASPKDVRNLVEKIKEMIESSFWHRPEKRTKQGGYMYWIPHDKMLPLINALERVQLKMSEPAPGKVGQGEIKEMELRLSRLYSAIEQVDRAGLQKESIAVVKELIENEINYLARRLNVLGPKKEEEKCPS